MAALMPREPPVTRVTLPVSFFDMCIAPWVKRFPDFNGFKASAAGVIQCPLQDVGGGQFVDHFAAPAARQVGLVDHHACDGGG